MANWLHRASKGPGPSSISSVNGKQVTTWICSFPLHKTLSTQVLDGLLQMKYHRSSAIILISFLSSHLADNRMIPVVIWGASATCLTRFILAVPCRFPISDNSGTGTEYGPTCLPASLQFSLFRNVCRCAEWLEAATLHSPQVREGGTRLSGPESHPWLVALRWVSTWWPMGGQDIHGGISPDSFNHQRF